MQSKRKITKLTNATYNVMPPPNIRPHIRTPITPDLDYIPEYTTTYPLPTTSIISPPGSGPPGPRGMIWDGEENLDFGGLGGTWDTEKEEMNSMEIFKGMVRHRLS